MGVLRKLLGFLLLLLLGLLLFVELTVSVWTNCFGAEKVGFVIDGGLYFFVDIFLYFGDLFGKVLLILLCDLILEFFFKFR